MYPLVFITNIVKLESLMHFNDQRQNMFRGSLSQLSTAVDSVCESQSQPMPRNRSRAGRPAINQFSIRKDALLSQMNQFNGFLTRLIDRFQYQQCPVREKIGIFSDVIERQGEISLQFYQLVRLLNLHQQTQSNNQVVCLMAMINNTVHRFWRSLKIQEGYRNNQRQQDRQKRQENEHRAISSEKFLYNNRGLGVNQDERSDLHPLRSQEKFLQKNNNIDNRRKPKQK